MFCLYLVTQEVYPDKYARVQQLSGLKQLEHLTIWAKDWDATKRVARYCHNETTPAFPVRLLSSLTALTRLESNLLDVEPLSCISSCVGLQHLSVCGGPVEPFHRQLEPDQWACLAQLTCLTHLRLLNATLIEASPEASAALSKLAKLQLLAAQKWDTTFMPAVAGCTQLTEICGEWQISDAHVGLTLPHVLVLSGAWYEAPVARFPNLQRFCVSTCVAGHPMPDSRYVATYPGQLAYMSQLCTSLEELELTSDAGSLLWVPGCERGHVAAIQSLTSLQLLTCLRFTPRDDFDLVALVRACSVLEGHSLQEAQVSSDAGCFVSIPAWVQLGQLRKLLQLSLNFKLMATCRQLATAAFAFVSALSGCGYVYLGLPGWDPDVVDRFRAAVTAAREAGLLVPQVGCSMHRCGMCHHEYL
jgi:hypothetical protein